MRLVRTLTLAIPSGRASFAPSNKAKTYLVRFSGTVGFAGFELGVYDAPGTFSVNALPNDVFFSRFAPSRLAVPGTPGAYQVAMQLDAGGKALRYADIDSGRTPNPAPGDDERL